ncbi:DUF6894 family protein [Sphingosinicella rhizophila]|uniref:DUF6894 domain-containing protein n=1 Tax=Sphingosinicella rhizophila TaxID=3050082 RepID=A0ABU3Q7K1_9SPHN|nr:hypothetical protein [Sphingosinicella sp. GR2756]MDT9599376.1 hypothetical protein [Sphingosinicella sp. GR2756]
MPLFFFHIVSPNERIEDPEGLELTDVDTARREAVESLRSIISHEVRQGILGLDEWIEVVDFRGDLLLVVRSGDVLTLTTARNSKEDTVKALRP